MPTGYTAGIIDGEITTFEQFAKRCIKAFGVAVHMRDDSLSKEWEPRVPSDYHEKALKKARKELYDSVHMSDEEILELEISSLESSLDYHMNQIKERGWIRNTLTKMLVEATKYNPPTDEHEGIAGFMIDQLQITIDSDGDDSWNRNKISEINKALKDLDSASIRNRIKEKAEESIKYHEDNHQKELKRCEEVNEFVRVFFDSLKQMI